jgi:hypothetical protein
MYLRYYDIVGSHHLAIGAIIALIIFLQLHFYLKNKKSRGIFLRIFPAAAEEEVQIEKDDFGVQGLATTHQNAIWQAIISSINKYLSNNKGAVSDFHLIKDIVDRNCDAKEEEIQAQIPVPLYLGLVGAMAGILIGILYLWLSGGLRNLLTAGSDTAAQGVEALLGGVALAMASSICGIILTTRGSLKVKREKVRVEAYKNDFLSWMQAELLPSLSNDTAQTLERLSQNLKNFNTDFASNTKEFKNTTLTVTSSYQNLENVLVVLNKLKITEIASANIEVYEKLQSCTNEIGKLGSYLQGVNRYQANTADAIEKMQMFFARGVEQIDGINLGVKNAMERFSENTDAYLKNLQEKLNGQTLEVYNATAQQQAALQEHFGAIFNTLVAALKEQNDALQKHFEAASAQIQLSTNEQQEIFKQKLNETTALVDELKNLSAVKSSMSELLKATNEQNKKLDRVADAIEKMLKKEKKTTSMETNSKIMLKTLSEPRSAIILSGVFAIILVFLVLIILIIV